MRLRQFFGQSHVPRPRGSAAMPLTIARNLPGGFGHLRLGPFRITEEDRQSGVMGLQRFAQVLGVIRVEDRDGAHVRPCQKASQS